jgi:hypothetical protein
MPSFAPEAGAKFAETKMARSGWAVAAMLVLGGLVLAGCDGGGAPTRTKSIVAANPYHEKLAALSELNRSLALRRAVQDAGEPCKRIDASAYQGSTSRSTCGPRAAPKETARREMSSGSSSRPMAMSRCAGARI